MATGEGAPGWKAYGPITIGQASDFLRHCHVTIKPVIDLDIDVPVDSYEVPTRMREHSTCEIPPGFPWSPSTSRRMDVDHTTPWTRRPDEPQTRIGNLGKLTRFEHRTKTHGPGWRHRQPEPGVHVWRTPHGYQFRVDASGTHFLGKVPAAGTPLERAFVAIFDR